MKKEKIEHFLQSNRGEAARTPERKRVQGSACVEFTTTIIITFQFLKLRWEVLAHGSGSLVTAPWRALWSLWLDGMEKDLWALLLWEGIAPSHLRSFQPGALNCSSAPPGLRQTQNTPLQLQALLEVLLMAWTDAGHTLALAPKFCSLGERGIQPLSLNFRLSEVKKERAGHVTGVSRNYEHTYIH